MVIEKLDPITFTTKLFFVVFVVFFFNKYTCTFKYIVFVIKFSGFSGFIYFLVLHVLSNLCIT